MMTKTLPTGSLKSDSIIENYQRNINNYDFANKLDAVRYMQHFSENYILCGSMALILCGAMDYRPVGDIDFVINESDFDDRLIGSMMYLRRDSYRGYFNTEIAEVDDNYTSWHATYHNKGFKQQLNFLVFNDDIQIKRQWLHLPHKDILIQDVDTMLQYKEKYNRSKDINDLNNIATKAIEEILLDKEDK